MPSTERREESVAAPSRPDPTPRVVWWLLGVFSAVAISLVSAWGTGVGTRLDKLTVEADGTATQAAVLSAGLPGIVARLDRIEKKVDNLRGR